MGVFFVTKLSRIACYTKGMEIEQRRKIITTLQAPRAEQGFGKSPEYAQRMVATTERVEAKLIEYLGADALYTYPLGNGITGTMTIDKIWPVCGAPIATLEEQVMFDSFIDYFNATSKLSNEALRASLTKGFELEAKYL